MTPPFTVLHVCMGNICRSPMAERLLRGRAAEIVGDRVDDLLHSHSVGTGGWHVGEPMQPPAARQLRRLGMDPEGHAARRLALEHIEASDLILTATVDQWEFVTSLAPDAASRVFVLGQFGRLLGQTELVDLPPVAHTPEAVHARGVALVDLVDRVRKGSDPIPQDDLADPYGMDDRFYARVADQIDATVRPLAVALLRG